MIVVVFPYRNKFANIREAYIQIIAQQLTFKTFSLYRAPILHTLAFPFFTGADTIHIQMYAHTSAINEPIMIYLVLRVRPVGVKL